MLKKYIKNMQFLLFLIIFIFLENVVVLAEEPENDIKNGIIAVQIGYELQDGDFYPVKNANGCLVSNSFDGAYVVTMNHSVLITKKERKRFYKKRKISVKNTDIRESIRFVVKGDILNL